MKETEEKDKFDEIAEAFLLYLTFLKCDFREYFETYYLAEGKVSFWAMCFRLGIHLHTNNFLESMHKVLKHIFMKGKKLRRLDLAILAYLKLIDYKVHQRLVKVIFGTRNKDCARKHSAGIKLLVFQHPRDERSFYVTSESTQDKDYLVKKLQDCNACKARCSACKVCRHMIL